MQNNNKKCFIPVDGTPIEVSEEVYRAYYQPIWNTRYHAQKNGECRCTKSQLWKCDGVCPGCPFYAAGKNVSIDTPIGGEEDGVVGMGECADPNECKMVADLGIDFLAAGIGNIHGKYPANWKGLSFETLAAVQELTGELPLVLHGGTGIPADQIKKAIDLGVSKINVNTECQLAFADATRKYIEAGKDLEGKGFDPRKLLAPGAEAIKATVKEKMELFGSVGKAE